MHKYGSLYDSEELLEKVTGDELNPKYFIDALKDKTDEVEIKFTSAISPIVIEQDDITELILPVRLVK